MKKTYFVRSFDLVAVASACLVVTDGRTWRIGSPSALALLQKLIAKARTSIPESELSAIIEATNLPKDKAMSFLTNDAGVLLEVRATPKEFKKVIFFSNTEIQESYISGFMKKEGIVQVQVVRDPLDLTLAFSHQTDILAVVLLQDYDAEVINMLTAAVSSSAGSAYLLGYMIGSVLNIDSPYIPGYGLPTHADHMSQWRKISSEGNSSSAWLDLLDLYHENDTHFRNPYCLEELEQFLCAFHIIKRASEIIGSGKSLVHINQLLYASRLDVTDGRYTTHKVGHSKRRAGND